MSKLFAIGLEVEEVAVGKVLRTLDSMPGVARIHLKLSGHKNGEIAEGSELAALPAPQRRSTHQEGLDPKRGRCDQAVADALKDGERPVKEITDFIVSRGFAAVSINSQIHNMKDKGHVKRVGMGIWQLTSAGYRHFHKDQAKSQPAQTKASGKGYKEPDNSKGARRVVLDFLRLGYKTSAELTNELKRHKLSPKNMSGTVYKMRHGPQATITVRDGIYSITPYGTSIIDKIIESEQSNRSQAAE